MRARWTHAPGCRISAPQSWFKVRHLLMLRGRCPNPKRHGWRFDATDCPQGPWADRLLKTPSRLSIWNREGGIEAFSAHMFPSNFSLFTSNLGGDVVSRRTAIIEPAHCTVLSVVLEWAGKNGRDRTHVSSATVNNVSR